MMRKIVPLLTVFWISGCSGLATVPSSLYMGRHEYVKVSELTGTMRLQDLQQRLGDTITASRAVNGPNATGKAIIILQCENGVEEYIGEGPVWLLFEDDAYVAHGLGDATYAELLWSTAYYDYMRQEGKISRADAERGKYQKLTDLYKTTSYEDEYFTYRIVVAGQLDRKEIDSDTANYLVAQKKAELDTKVATARNNAIAVAQRQELIGLNRTVLLMQTLRPIQPLPSRSSKNVNCTTTQFGTTWFTNCY